MIKKFTLVIFILTTLNLSAQNIELYTQFLGKYDFTMIGNTMNELPNGANSYCGFLTETSATLSLNPDQEIVAAFLYWSGSGSLSNGDLDIKLNGVDVNVERTFLTNLADRPVYGAFSDVTAQVQATGNGVYTISDFDLSSVIPQYCTNGTNFGGWSILVVYQDDNTTNNLVNVYDGFVRVDSQNQSVTVNLNNLNVLQIVGNKIAFITFEGDQNISNAETLRVNGNVVENPPLNPWNNAFNGTNSFTNDSNFYNMDLDYYDINDYTDVGDNDLSIQLNSAQDAVLIQNITLVLNSEVPDATIEVDAAIGPCDNRDVNIDYTVYNTIATDELPAGTPIAFYADGTLVETAFTQNELPIGGSESGNIVLTIPPNIPSSFTLEIAVDDDGTGQSTVIEFNEENNSQLIPIILGVTPTVNPFDDMVICDSNNDGEEIFNLTTVGNQMLGAQTGVQIRYYNDQNDAIAGNNNNITTPNAYTNATSPETIWVRMEDVAGCNVITPFQIEITAPTELSFNLPNLEKCAETEILIGVEFDLTENNMEVLNGDDPDLFTITYHISQEDAMSGDNAIADPVNYPNLSTPQIIWVRKMDQNGCVQYKSFQIIVIPSGELTYAIANLVNCAPTNDLTGVLIDLTENEPAILNGNDPSTFTISYHLDQNGAINGTGTIPDPQNYSNTSSPQTIWVRLVSMEGCVQFGSFEIELTAPEILAYSIEELQLCSSDQILTGISTDLTVHESFILNGQDPNSLTLTYHLTENGATNNLDEITDPENYSNISSPQTIWVRLVDENGCVQFGSFELLYRAAPLANDAMKEECSMYGPATFNLTTVNELVIADTDGFIFSYYLSQNDAENQINPLSNSYTPPTQSFTIFVRIEDDFGCFSIVEVELNTVINTETIADTYYLCDDPYKVNDGFERFDLPSLETEVNSILGLTGSVITYHISPEDAGTGNNSIPDPSNYQNTSNPQTIYARAVGTNGECGGIAQFTIEVLPVPEFDLAEEIAYCSDDASKMFNFYQLFSTYTWYDADGDIVSNSSSIEFSEGGVYTLEVTETGLNCPARRDINVIIDDDPIISQIKVDAHTVTVYANGGQGPYEYSYNNGLTWHDSYILEDVPGGIHYLLVKSYYGCISEAKIFGVLGIPNVLTPNGDGFNDYWEIRGLETYPDAHIKIFDRYGKIFMDRKIGTDFKWDGTYLGNPVSSGDYWYLITVEGQQLSGHVSIRNRK